MREGREQPPVAISVPARYRERFRSCNPFDRLLPRHCFGEISGTIAQAQLLVAHLWISDLDSHLAKRAVALLVRRGISNQILRTKFLLNLCEGGLQVVFFLRKKSPPARAFSYVIQRAFINAFVSLIADANRIDNSFQLHRLIDCRAS